MAQIITIARGMGSGGRTIGRMLSEQLGMKYYDKDLIKLASEDSGINEAFFGRVDEKLKTSFIKRGGVYKGGVIDPSSKEFTSDKNLFNFQAKIIKELADKEPAVIVGRCADFILRDRDDVIRLFIHCDEDTAVKNVIDAYGVEEKEAHRIVEHTDKDRSEYYKHYTGRSWTDARNYNICLDTSRLDYDTCVEIIKGYIAIISK
ncbi:Cytidylate kinase [Ruminococcus sp. YE71]|uniref:cytidylate kinase-like family protein n=1 Tax=unclassified Ruminococcus TaxID=2608920 RepID=UPI00088E8C9C|nr:MULTISPECIES: cytidylate kinase-like family protein [unclassified Ruminococcus]SDA27382.1 Cytidylate kinase [Ruminococcus sp. YE78]SFW45142.1 Cytidylate kinase [Ruminococcus sp. YE71]